MSTAPSDGETRSTAGDHERYRLAWIERLDGGGVNGLPVARIEPCIADSILTALDTARFAHAGIDSEGLADGGPLDDLKVTAEELADVANGLASCALEDSYASALRRVMPAFVTEEGADCVGNAIGQDPGYAEGLAASVLDATETDWLDNVAEPFNGALVACPHVYGLMTVSALDRDHGPFPPEGFDCMREALEASAAELLGPDPATADATLHRIGDECRADLGDSYGRIFGT